MEAHDEELVKSLAATHPELKAAYDSHTRLAAQVEQLTSKSHLSPSEEVEKKNLQKMKLAEKTKIMKFLEEYRRGQVSTGSAPSPTSARYIASRISGVGCVTVSLRKSIMSTSERNIASQALLRSRLNTFSPPNDKLPARDIEKSETPRGNDARCPNQPVRLHTPRWVRPFRHHAHQREKHTPDPEDR